MFLIMWVLKMTRQPFPEISLYLGHVNTSGVQAVNNLTMMLRAVFIMMMMAMNDDDGGRWR